MATFNKEDLIKWNDLSTSLQDIIMRKITWNMLHPDLQAWLLDKERRIIELERWRRTKADPMLDDHENRIDSLETQVTNLWSKLGDTEDQMEDIAKNAACSGLYKLLDWKFSDARRINPNVLTYSGHIEASFISPDFVSGVGTLKVTMSFSISLTRVVSSLVYVPVGPFGQNSTSSGLIFDVLPGGIIFGANSLYWTSERIGVSPFDTCFPYIRLIPNAPMDIIHMQATGYSYYYPIDPMTFKGFNVNNLYNIHNGGFYYSLPTPTDLLRGIIVT